MNQILPTTDRPGAARIAIIWSLWHADLVGRARAAFLAEMQRRGWPPDALEAHEVPGAFEIPLLAQSLARRGDVAPVVACARVVDGGIYRHDFVAGAVLDGLMRVQLDTGVPVFSVVLTPHAFHEHEEHREFFGEHLVKKGREAAAACAHVLARGRVPAGGAAMSAA
jgi:6,7-dimethyl-8-ribityllumazine synthase